MDDNTPIYNLKAVMHEVGLSAATLRAWELRYGLPKPQRTAGGHRLYSRQDIELIKWLIEQQKEGLSISRAVELWKSMDEEKKLGAVKVVPARLEKAIGEDILDELRMNWIAACVGYNDHAANQVLDQAFAIATPETVCIELLRKGLAEIGERWYAGRLSVQQEHFASAVALRRINHLLAAEAPPTRVDRILAACPPGEQHDFILLLVTYLLRRNGWDVIYLGGNVPIKDIDRTIKSTHPKLIVSSVQTLTSVASLRMLSESDLLQGVLLAYGGGIFEALPYLTGYINGYYLGQALIRVPQIIEQLFKTAPEVSRPQPVAEEYLRALAHYDENERNIAIEVVTAMKGEELETNLLNLATSNLSKEIGSSLTIGDINLLDYSAEWLNGLLKNYGYSTSILVKYYTAYYKAVKKYLGNQGVVIVDWLEKQITTM
jgi:DNA-binding transcriptional MerR regulator